MDRARNFAEIGRECVACGCCAAVCPLGAVTIDAGVAARVDSAKCVGCGKCAAACPAAVIRILAREAAV